MNLALLSEIPAVPKFFDCKLVLIKTKKFKLQPQFKTIQHKMLARQVSIK